MALILIAEDDSGTLRLISATLRLLGHEVLSATDGLSAWRLIEMRSPDLIVSDVNMPGMNGFALLQRLREHPTLAQTPFLLQTSLQDRQDMRQGMLLGADDYITKPLHPKELTEAVNAQLNRKQARAALQSSELNAAVTRALEEQAWDLHDQYEARLARELSEQWPQEDRANIATHYRDATVLFADIRNYHAWIAALTPAEMGLVIKRFYENSGDTVYLFGATAMHFVGEGVIAVYADSTDSSSAEHGLRAMKAAMGLRKAGAAMDAYVRDRLPERNLPPFDVGIALHRGPVAMTRLEGYLGGSTQTLPVGKTVVDAMAIQRIAPPIPGTVIASLPALRSTAGAVNVVGRYFLPVYAHEPAVEVCAVLPPGIRAKSAEQPPARQPSF